MAADHGDDEGLGWPMVCPYNCADQIEAIIARHRYAPGKAECPCRRETNPHAREAARADVHEDMAGAAGPRKSGNGREKRLGMTPAQFRMMLGDEPVALEKRNGKGSGRTVDNECAIRSVQVRRAGIGRVSIGRAGPSRRLR